MRHALMAVPPCPCWSSDKAQPRLQRVHEAAGAYSLCVIASPLVRCGFVFLAKFARLSPAVLLLDLLSFSSSLSFSYPHFSADSDLPPDLTWSYLLKL